MKEHPERCKSNLRKSSKRSADVSESGARSVIRSNSYIVPGNPLAPIHRDQPEDEPQCYSKFERVLTKQDSFMQLRDLKTPLEPISRKDNGSKQIQRECDVSTPTGRGSEQQKREKPGVVLPDIGLTAFLCCDKRAEEIKEALDQPDFQFIRHTRSGIAYNYMYGPPVTKPRRLPKIVSDGALMYKRKDEGEDDLRPAAKRPHKHKIRVKGEELADHIRSSAEKNRLEREQKHLEKSKGQLQMQEDRASRLGRVSRAGHTQSLIEDNAARIREVKAKQDEIREREHIRNMERMMKQMKRH